VSKISQKTLKVSVKTKVISIREEDYDYLVGLICKKQLKERKRIGFADVISDLVKFHKKIRN